MKLIIAGPPHSGKSVFISGLLNQLRALSFGATFKFDATPDGETRYVQENYDNADLINSIRKKGTYTDKFRKFIGNAITNSNHPLMIVDIGGRFNDNDKPMLENATDAIILSGGEIVTGENKGENDFESSVKEWENFFNEMKINVLATIKSDFDATEDSLNETTENGKYLGSIHHLERIDKTVNERPIIRKTAELILEKLKTEPATRGQFGKRVDGENMPECSSEKSLNNYELLEWLSLPANKERKFRLNEKDLENINFSHSFDKTKGAVLFEGGYSAHKLAYLVCNENESDNVLFRDEQVGIVDLKPLEIGTDDEKPYFDKTEFVGCYKGKRVYKVKVVLNRSQNVLTPDDLESLKIPKVPAGAIVQLSAPGADWFTALVARSYAVSGEVSGVAIHMPAGAHSKPLSAIVWVKSDSGLEICDKDKLINGSRENPITAKTAGVILDKPIVYIDMDGVLVDFDSGIEWAEENVENVKQEYFGRPDEIPNIFANMQPIPGAIEAAKWVSENFNAYILSTSPWRNPSALNDKLNWIKKHFGAENENPFFRKVIYTHHKDLQNGAILIDDRQMNGAYDFGGSHIWFGQKPFENWEKVKEVLKNFLTD